MNDAAPNSSCCPVCGASSARLWRTAPDQIQGGNERFRAVRCVRCRTVRLDPRPSAAQMARHYAPGTYARAEDDQDSGLGERLDVYNRKLAERVHQAARASYPKHALDVGCGDGRLLAMLAAIGWEVEGLETDPDAARLARKRLENGVIWETPLEETVLGAHRFGLLTLHHVLEHVPDPRATLQAAYRLLAPGGTLYIAVPNVAAWEAGLFRSAWYPLDLPRHFWGFTPHSLTRLMETCGFAPSRPRYFPLLFVPQSVRYARRMLSGHPPGGGGISETTAASDPAGSSRSRIFRALLNFSERLGRRIPGEVMEISAVKGSDRP